MQHLILNRAVVMAMMSTVGVACTLGVVQEVHLCAALVVGRLVLMEFKATGKPVVVAVPLESRV
jgi:hypothetical protein